MLAVVCAALLLLTSCSIAEDILYGTLDVLEQSLMDEDEVANESLSADALTETVGYGAETVYVDPTEAQTLRYWRNTLKSDGERAAYDRIVEMAASFQDTAHFTLPVSFGQIEPVYTFPEKVCTRTFSVTQ